ncbi:MAG: phenylalanine--tRNA ligase subunit beta, partial [Gammaproteobacteria bacterium]
GRSATVTRGDGVVGHIGTLHPSLAKALDLDTDVYAFEFDIAPLAARTVPRSQPIARFPSVRRDLSFELPESVNYATVESAVRGAVGASLRQIFVFDRYAGHNLGTGLKSLAIGLILQDDYRTLTDGDADASVALAVA